MLERMRQAQDARVVALAEGGLRTTEPSYPDRIIAYYVLPFLIATFWATAGLVRQRTFRTGVDLGLYTEAVQGYSRGGWPWSALKAQSGFNLLGDHFTPIVSVLGPVYRLLPHIEVLIVAQAIAIGITSAILARAASAVMGPGFVAASVCVSFGLSWGIAGMAIFDFHEVALGLPILATALTYALRKQWTLALLWMLPLMLVKEDSAFLILGFALTCWASGKRKVAMTALGSGVALFSIVVGTVIPSLSFYGRYTYWAASGSEIAAHQSLLKNLFHNLWSSIISAQSLRTTMLILACSGLLAVWSPIALVLLPPLLIRFVSASPGFWGIHEHYNALLMVVVFFSLLDGYRRVRFFLSERVTVWRFTAALLALNLALSWFISSSYLATTDAYACHRCASAQALLNQIPSGTEVIADTFLVDHLVDRTTVHLLVPYLVDSAGRPLTSQWIALDTQDRSTFPDTQSALAHGVAIAKARGFVQVWSSPDGFILLRYDPVRARLLSA